MQVAAEQGKIAGPVAHDFHQLERSELNMLRFHYDELGSKALTKLLEITDPKESSSPCPMPRVDLYTALEDARESSEVLAELWMEVNTIPLWVEWTQIARGQQIFYKNALANIVGFAFQGFIGENAAALGPAEVLVRTGGLSEKNLVQRVLETFQWVLEVTESIESIMPGGRGHISTIRVRLLHAAVRHKILRLAEMRPSYFPTETHGIPINTFDAILTLTFFCCNPIWLQLPQFGIHLSEQERQDYVALYRYLGYLLGVPDNYFSSAEQAQSVMAIIHGNKKSPQQASRKITHAFINSLADRGPWPVSKSFLDAASRSMNSENLCDELGISRPGFVYYLAFSGLRCLIKSLSVLQEISVINANIVKFWKTCLPKIIIESHLALGGSTKFELRYEPSLRGPNSGRTTTNSRNIHGRANKANLYALEIIFLTILASLAAISVIGGLLSLKLLLHVLSLSPWRKWAADASVLAW